MKGYSSLRKYRRSLANTPYHLTFATLKRFPYFSDHEAARAMCRAISFCDTKSWCRTLAYVVMPDHVHWLVVPDMKHMSELVRIVKERLAKSAFKVEWQKGFYDRAMRSEDEAIEVARYIIANPKRAGLVQRVGEYPYWNACYL